MLDLNAIQEHFLAELTRKLGRESALMSSGELGEMVDRYLRLAYERGAWECSYESNREEDCLEDEVGVVVWVGIPKLLPISLVFMASELGDREVVLRAIKENLIDWLDSTDALDFGEFCTFSVEEDPNVADRRPTAEELAALQRLLGGERRNAQGG